jgi:hypothetical protein
MTVKRERFTVIGKRALTACAYCLWYLVVNNAFIFKGAVAAFLFIFSIWPFYERCLNADVFPIGFCGKYQVFVQVQFH